MRKSNRTTCNKRMSKSKLQKNNLKLAMIFLKNRNLSCDKYGRLIIYGAIGDITMKTILKTIFYTALAMPLVSWADLATPPGSLDVELAAKIIVVGFRIVLFLVLIIATYLIIKTLTDTHEKTAAEPSHKKSVQHLSGQKKYPGMPFYMRWILLVLVLILDFLFICFYINDVFNLSATPPQKYNVKIDKELNHSNSRNNNAAW